MKPGRNDPCPCGSGKKYKQCCLAASVASAESPGELAWRRLRRANEGLIGKMMQFVVEAYGPEAIDEAWAEFMFWEEEEDWQDSPHRGAFLPWMLHHWCPDPDETIVLDESLHDMPPTRAYLQRAGRHFDPTTRRYLEACLAAPFGFHEITDCSPGHGFRSRELITGDQLEVLERSGSQSLRKGDVMFASMVQCDGIVMMEGAAPVPIAPIRSLPILEFRKRIAKAPDMSSRELLREWDCELRALYLSIIGPILHPVAPELRNTDGDALSLQRLVFEIDSAQEAFDALKHLALDASDEELLSAAERATDGSLLRVEFQWVKAGNRVHKGWSNTSLGTIEINRAHLTVSVNSAERAARFKRIAGKVLHDRARYRATEIQSPEQAFATKQDDPMTAQGYAELANDPEVKAQLTQMLSQHYDSWLRQKIPALGGKTPLQAAKDPVGREMVAALVAQIERDGEKMVPPLDESIPRRLRERLGLRE